MGVNNLPPWPKDPIPGIGSLAKEQNRGLSQFDHLAITIYERALKEAYAARLRYLMAVAAQVEKDVAACMDVRGDLSDALAAIGDLPEQPGEGA